MAYGYHEPITDLVVIHADGPICQMLCLILSDEGYRVSEATSYAILSRIGCLRILGATSEQREGGNMLRVAIRRKMPQRLLPDGLTYVTIAPLTRRPRWFWMWKAGLSSRRPTPAAHRYVAEIGPIRILVSWGKPKSPPQASQRATP